MITKLTISNPGSEISDINTRVPLDHVKTTIFKRHRVSNINELSILDKLDIHEFSVELLYCQHIHRLIMECRPSDNEKCIATIFNGRFSPFKTAFHSLKSFCDDVIVHERGRMKSSYSFFKNITVENCETVATTIRNRSQTVLDASKQERLALYMNNEITGKASNSIDFASRNYIRELGDLSEEPYIIYYTSSLERKCHPSLILVLKD